MADKPDPRLTKAALQRVRIQAKTMTNLKAKARAARDSLDAEILAARQAGATYREIAAVAGVSTAWVQTSLERAGYQTKR